MPIIEPATITDGLGVRVQTKLIGSPAVASTTAIHAAAATLGSGGPQVITTGITNPDVPRGVTATAGGTAGDIKAVAVTVTGTDEYGNALTETLPAFTVDTAGTVQGSKAFKTVTSYSVPAMDGTGATVAIGTNEKLGLGVALARNTVIAAYLNGTKEGTAPTVATSTSEMASNTVDLNSACNGNPVIVDFYQS